jgi:hypothetical protein
MSIGKSIDPAPDYRLIVNGLLKIAKTHLDNVTNTDITNVLTLGSQSINFCHI